MSGPTSFCFVHAADLHLDTPFKGLSSLSPSVAEALRDASLDAFDAIVELTIERAAAFLLLGGDIYDGAERGLRAQLRFRAGLERLSGAGIATFVVHGNHDPIGTGWSAISNWPELVTVFPSEEVLVVPVMRDGERLATVQGLSYHRRAETDNLALALKRPSGDGIHIGLLHCNVQGAAEEHANYSPCTLEDLRATGLDYLALGHVHKRRILSGGRGEPYVVYPGNTQARSMRPSEIEPKGAMVVEVRDGHIDDVAFHPCDRVRFELVEIAPGATDDLGLLAELLRLAGAEALERAEGRSVVLRARLCGETRLCRDLGRPGVLEELLANLRQDRSSLDPFLWWDGIENETRSEIRDDEAFLREDFGGDLLRLAGELSPAVLSEQGFLEELGTLPRALSGVLVRLAEDGALAEHLLAHAARLALAELEQARP